MPEDQRRSLPWIVTGWLASTLAAWTTFGESMLAGPFVSRPGWLALLPWLGSSAPSPDAPDYADPSLIVVGLLVAMTLGFAAALLKYSHGSQLSLIGSNESANRFSTWPDALTFVGKLAFIPGIWFVALYACLILNWSAGYTVVASTIDLVIALTIACWLAAVFAGWTSGHRDDDVSPRTARWILAGIVAAYVIPFVWMNWGQYWNLRTPHGDTAMYEEHLWNLLHGKGFRSYLDQGLFLGEHIQVVHLLLIPIYVLYPSHLTLELCESLAIGSTAIPAYLIASRHSQSRRIGLWIAAAVLLYAPLHYLDIEIDHKSFRPIAFGVPAMLWAFQFVETKRWKLFALAAVIAIMSKEDYTLILGPLGLWIAWNNWRLAQNKNASTADVEEQESSRLGFTDSWMFGLFVAAVSAIYLLLAVKVIIPWFRGGETVHYARYFSKFGETPTGILWGMLTKPGLLFSSLVTPLTVLYVLRTLAPLAFTPFLSPSRFLVGVPIFGLLLLNQLSLDPPSPVHHFHAPLVPVLLWAMAAGVGRWASRPAVEPDRSANLGTRLCRSLPTGRVIAVLPCFAALTTGLTLSFSPLSLSFWDSGRSAYWRNVYVPGERTSQLAKVMAAIPPTSRVASTDYVHPRFTHYERSYDYSNYVRKVAGYEDRVPDDTDCIVIDVRGPYSEVHSAEDVRELRETPDKWELSPIDTDGYFIVLKRRNQPVNSDLAN